MDPKWDRIIGDRVFLVSAILAIVFAMLCGMAVDAGQVAITVNSKKQVVSGANAPTAFWSIVAGLGLASATSAMVGWQCFKARKAHEEKG